MTNVAVLGKVRAAARRNTAIFAKCWRRGVNPAAHQFDMALRVDGPAQFQADFWPRDHGKSEIFCLSFPLRRICEDPNIRILIVQKTATEAEKTLGVIKTELESNRLLKEFYAPHWRAVVQVSDICNAGGAVSLDGVKEGAWQQRRIYVKRTRRGKDPTVEAVGVGGAVTGGHFDIIILDDVEDDENTRTNERLASLVNWFTGTVMQLREPHTKLVIVGTLKTLKLDIYAQVLASEVWDTFQTGAILSHKLEEIVYTPVRENASGRVIGVTCATPDVVTLWPQKWPIEALLFEMLASPDRAVWIREKMNDLRALAGKIFRRDHFGFFDEQELEHILALGGFDLLIQSWDTAFEEKKEADWSVCGTMGLYQYRVYVLDVFRAKLDAPGLKAAMLAQYATWHPDEVLVEDVGAGKSMVQTLRKETRLPIVGVSTGGKDKVTRARVVTVYTGEEPAAQRILLRSGAPWLPALLTELTLFPDDENDDQADMLSQGVKHLMVGEGEEAWVVKRKG